MDAILWLAIALAIYVVKKSASVEGLSIDSIFACRNLLLRQTFAQEANASLKLYQTVLKFEALTF